VKYRGLKCPNVPGCRFEAIARLLGVEIHVVRMCGEGNGIKDLRERYEEEKKEGREER